MRHIEAVLVVFLFLLFLSSLEMYRIPSRVSLHVNNVNRVLAWLLVSHNVVSAAELQELVEQLRLETCVALNDTQPPEGFGDYVVFKALFLGYNGTYKPYVVKIYVKP